MIGFEPILMQVASNGTGVIIPAPDIFEQINTIMVAVAALITTVGGLATFLITKIRSVRREELTERDKMIIEGLKTGQMAVQKSAEILGQNKKVIKALYEADIPAEQRAKLEKALSPILEETNIMLQKANEQASMVKGRATQYFGESADVDQDKSIPREDAKISISARTA